MAGFLEQALHIYAYRVEHAFTEAKSAWDVLTRGRSGKNDVGKQKSASGKEDGDAEGGGNVASLSSFHDKNLNVFDFKGS